MRGKQNFFKKNAAVLQTAVLRPFVLAERHHGRQRLAERLRVVRGLEHLCSVGGQDLRPGACNGSTFLGITTSDSDEEDQMGGGILFSGDNGRKMYGHNIEQATRTTKVKVYGVYLAEYIRL